MKILLVSIITIFTFILTAKSLTTDKGSHYIIIKKIGDIELREYKELLYVSYIPENIKDRNNSFKEVASYIFGGNTTQTKIDMTSPVVIKLHNKNEMAFIMPEEYTLKSLPQTANKKLSIYEEPSNIKACISYSGYSNKQKEEKHINKLKESLNKLNIAYKNDFELLVYNSPYQFINRKNEIVVSIEYNEMIKEKENSNIKKIYLGGGCFWCIEAVFEDVIGVKNVISGFSGGDIKNPSYKEVSRGLTEHAEVCEITYNTEEISLTDLLKIFFLSHDPTTLNRQGNDIGKHYRSIILYNNNKEKIYIENYISKINKEIFDNKVVTELKQFNSFFKAEEYHQNYYQENSSQPYCRAVISPKVNKAKKELSKYYK